MIDTPSLIWGCINTIRTRSLPEKNKSHLFLVSETWSRKPMDQTPVPNTSESENFESWANPVQRMTVSEVPAGAKNINLHGKRLATPLKGFGQLFRKTYRIRFENVTVNPAAVVDRWKKNFPVYQPPENKFFPTMAGIRPGEVVFVEGKVPPLPGMKPFLPVASGVMVLYADDTSFSIVTPEGFPEAGYNTWSAYRDNDGVTVAQVQTFARTADPIYEFFYMFLGVTAHQDHIWSYVLERLAESFGVEGKAIVDKEIIDPRYQWNEVFSVYRNAAARTVFYLLGAPIRWITRKLNKKPAAH
jgi:hypothetical protein